MSPLQFLVFILKQERPAWGRVVLSQQKDTLENMVVYSEGAREQPSLINGIGRQRPVAEQLAKMHKHMYN